MTAAAATIDLCELLASITDEDAAAADAAYEAQFAAAHVIVVDGVRYTHDTTCKRCGGTGNLPHYWRVQGGRCFDCTVRVH